MPEIYKGYEIVQKMGTYYIFVNSKNGKFLCQQPSMEFAKKWIDQIERKQSDE